MLPEAPFKILLPFGGSRRGVVRRRPAVAPSGGDLHLRCDACGSTDFTVHVRPLVGLVQGAARVTVLACSVCGRLHRLDDAGRVGGSLTFDRTRDARHRERINHRHDEPA